MHRAALILLTLLAAAFLAVSCAAPSSPAGNSGNQPHLPPPDFDAIEAPAELRYCGNIRGGAGQTCAADEYCHREIKGMCGAADVPGTCRTKPQGCFSIYEPVCGCDGKTYGNECEANAKGVSAAALGECRL